MNAQTNQRLQDLQAYFDKAADTWDMCSDVEPDTVRSILAFAAIQPGETILDVGCGTGILVPYLLEQSAPTGHVLALDLSPRMLEVCRRKYGTQGAEERETRLSFVLGPAEAIPLPARRCDVVVCLSVFPHFADKPAALAQIARVLRPGGRLLIAHTDSRRAINRFHHQVGDIVGRDLLPDRGEMVTLLRGAGLVVATILDAPDRYVALATKL